MSELLVPIAISSQLDVTGEERIHAAQYNPTTRAIYVPTATPFQIMVMQGGANDVTGFSLVNYDIDANTATTVAHLDTENDAWKSRPFALGTDYALVKQSAPDEPHVRIYRQDGAGFELMDQTVNSDGRIGYGAVKLTDSRFVAISKLADNSYEVDLLNWDSAEGTLTVVDTVPITGSHGGPGYLNSCLCLGKAVFYMSGMSSNRFLTCSAVGDTLTCTFSTANPTGAGTFGSGLTAIGDKIQMARGPIWQFDGVSDMTLVQATSDGTTFNTTDDEHFFANNASFAETFWRLADSPYTETLIATQFKSTPGGGNGYIFIPGDSQFFGANNHGVYQFNGSTYVKLLDFMFSEFNAGDIGNLVATVVRYP